jgi:hypothetical protein
MKTKIKYYRCVTCKREYRAKYGEFTNDGFKCDRHARTRPMVIKVPVCKVCNRKTIPELITDGVCSVCTPLQRSKWSK